MNAFEIESLMDQEIETHHHEAMAPVARAAEGRRRPAGLRHRRGGAWAWSTPWRSVGEPPAVLGEMIAAALVGTFLGILLSYGFVGPLAGLLEQKVDESTKELQCIKVTLLASLHGYAPAAGGRVRPQGAVLDRAPDLHRARRARQAEALSAAPGQREP